MKEEKKGTYEHNMWLYTLSPAQSGGKKEGWVERTKINPEFFYKQACFAVV